MKKKIDAMHERFGTVGCVQCKDCTHLISGNWHDRRYHKCELYGLSHSEATDWRLSYPACGMFNGKVDIDHFTVTMKLLGRSKPPESPIAGQIGFNL